MTNLHGRFRHNHGTIDTWSDNMRILNLVFQWKKLWKNTFLYNDDRGAIKTNNLYSNQNISYWQQIWLILYTKFVMEGRTNLYEMKCCLLENKYIFLRG